MAYDSARQQVVLFGGTSSFSGRNDTWAFNGTNWTQLTPTTSPSGRYQHAMAYDAASQQVVLFGAYSSGNDTWVFNGTNWAQLSPMTIPPGRNEHAMAYDSARQQVVLFGGTSGSANFNDTWLFNGTNWSFSSDTAQLVFDMRPKPDGVWNFTSIDIPAGAIIKFIRNTANTPVVWLATSNVILNGELNLSGQNGLAAGATNQLAGNEAPGGPGGFAGGLGGIRFDQSGSYAGTPGQGPGGGLPGVTNSQAGAGAKHITAYGNAYLQPLVGGSGGGGRGSSATQNGGNGGGGGGAIYISSSRDIVVNGSIVANGGLGSSSAGGGSGGAIRLQADRISGNGSLQASGGSGSSPAGESGRIRLEAFFRTFLASGTYSGTLVGSAPVTNQTFQLTGNLLITSVAGQNVVQPPSGNTQNPDVVFTSAGPINVTATSTDIPDGTPVVLRVTSSGQVIQATNNLAGGAATFNVTVPAGVGTIQASATYTIGN